MMRATIVLLFCALMDGLASTPCLYVCSKVAWSVTVKKRAFNPTAARSPHLLKAAWTTLTLYVMWGQCARGPPCSFFWSMCRWVLHKFLEYVPVSAACNMPTPTCDKTYSRESKYRSPAGMGFSLAPKWSKRLEILQIWELQQPHSQHLSNNLVSSKHHSPDDGHVVALAEGIRNRLNQEQAARSFPLAQLLTSPLIDQSLAGRLHFLAAGSLWPPA
eukprot:scaffold137781_cov22-Tisochrysis_lutea.AAC.2